MKERLFICQCNNVEHQLIFRYVLEDEFPEVYCSVHLIAGSFWCRLKNSIKYLFG